MIKTFLPILLFGLYFSCELLNNFLTKGKENILLKISQFILVVYSIGYLFTQQVLPRNLFFPPGWILGIILGHMLYTLGFLLVIGVKKEVYSLFISFNEIIHFCFLSPTILFRTFSVALVEEIIYRGMLQSLLLSLLHFNWLPIVIVAVLFTLIHRHITQSTVMQNLEFFIFSITLGIIYFLTRDLGLVVTIHFLRNMETTYLEYIEKREELRDAEKALDAVEYSFLSREEVSS